MPSPCAPAPATIATLPANPDPSSIDAKALIELSPQLQILAMSHCLTERHS
jgi:hypothetical protein